MNSMRSCSTPLWVSRPSPPLIWRLQTASACRDLSTNSAVSAGDLGVERRGRDAAQREPDRRRLGSAQQPSRVDQLARALHSDRARQPDRSAAAGHSAGRRLAVADLRVVGGEDQVTGQRELEPGAATRSRRPPRSPERRAPRARGTSRRRGSARARSTRSPPNAASSTLGGDAGAEDAVATADHEHAHALVGLHAGDDVVDVVERLLGEAVALIRARERRGGDPTLSRVVERRVAGRAVRSRCVLSLARRRRAGRDAMLSPPIRSSPCPASLQAHVRCTRSSTPPARTSTDDIWDYIAGAAETETTTRRNRLALDSLALAPRVLRDVSNVDPSSTLLGHPLRIPVLLAPLGALELITPEGAVAQVRAAERFGLIAFVSSVAEPSLEEVAAAARRAEDRPALHPRRRGLGRRARRSRHSPPGTRRSR